MQPRQKCNAALHFLIMPSVTLLRQRVAVSLHNHHSLLRACCLYCLLSFYQSILSSLRRSVASTSSSLAIFIRLPKSVWQVFVHHLDMVVLSFSRCSPSYLFVFFFSARTTFSLFNSLFAIFRHKFKYKDNYNTSQSCMNTEEFMSVYQLGEVRSLLTVWI